MNRNGCCVLTLAGIMGGVGAQGIKDGKIKYKLDVQKGLDKYIDVVNMLYTGANTGKLILEL